MRTKIMKLNGREGSFESLARHDEWSKTAFMHDDGNFVLRVENSSKLSESNGRTRQHERKLKLFRCCKNAIYIRYILKNVDNT